MKYLLILLCIVVTSNCFAQNFSSNIKTAKAAYAANKLEDSHFALLQAMQEIDLIIGKEVLKLLPSKMDIYILKMLLTFL